MSGIISCQKGIINWLVKHNYLPKSTKGYGDIIKRYKSETGNGLQMGSFYVNQVYGGRREKQFDNQQRQFQKFTQWVMKNCEKIN